MGKGLGVLIALALTLGPTVFPVAAEDSGKVVIVESSSNGNRAP
jgi:hypothetical protein